MNDAAVLPPVRVPLATECVRFCSPPIAPAHHRQTRWLHQRAHSVEIPVVLNIITKGLYTRLRPTPVTNWRSGTQEAIRVPMATAFTGHDARDLSAPSATDARSGHGMGSAERGSGFDNRRSLDRVDRPVALRIIPGALGSDAGSHSRRHWLREARAVSRVRHPNIVPLYDYGEADGCYYLVLEYIPGGSLKKRLEGPLPPRIAAGLMETIARAVGHIHEHGLFHLDLKPSNILLDGEVDAPWDVVTPRVSDFGLAVSEGGHDVSDTSLACPRGTPSYMAPEQASASRDQIVHSKSGWTQSKRNLSRSIGWRHPQESTISSPRTGRIAWRCTCPRPRIPARGGRARMPNSDISSYSHSMRGPRSSAMSPDSATPAGPSTGFMRSPSSWSHDTRINPPRTSACTMRSCSGPRTPGRSTIEPPSSGTGGWPSTRRARPCGSIPQDARARYRVTDLQGRLDDLLAPQRETEAHGLSVRSVLKTGL
jgi:serine/threonine protein kinase